MVKNKNWIAEIFCNKFFDQPETCFTLSAEILARSWADRDRNLLFMRCVNEQERLSMDPLVCLWIHSAIAAWMHIYFDNVITKFMINNKTDAWKSDVNLFPFPAL